MTSNRTRPSGPESCRLHGHPDQDQITEYYSSHINNYEINVILPYASWQWLAGFRYLTVTERFDLNAVSAVTGNGDYQIISDNRLYGGQLGARTQLAAALSPRVHQHKKHK